MTANPYIRFERISDAMPIVKTEVWVVINRRAELEIGRIKWYGPWRQYAFFPDEGTIWNKDCLDAVNEQIETLMRLRRNVRVNQGKEMIA